jgi:pentatricopeptide repeat protein
VAAVHPDYVLRQEVLRKLRDQWLPLSPEGWHYVVAGQIREHQFELALDNIANMERKDIPIEEWLHSLLIYYLCEFQEMDQVLQLMRSRLSQGHTMTNEFWTHVLNAATVARHHDLIHFIWSRVVESGEFQPAPRLYAQVLVSTRDGGELTTSVLRLIAHNNITFQDEDYVHWCEAVLAANNLGSALRVLCEMQQAGFAVPRSSTKPILAHCLEKKFRPRDVWKILRGIKYAGFVIPLACARVVIELCEKTAADDPFQVDDGISFYKELHMICPERPDTDIYNALISMCRVAQNTDSAMFVVQEMSAFGVLPDATTFEHLVLMCLDYENFESSYFYSEDMHEQGFAFSQEARIEIRNRCAGSSDEYAVKLKNLSGVSEDLPEPMKRKHIPNNEASLSPKEWVDLASKREYNKERRKRKRRLLAIAQSQQDDDYLEYEPSLSTPKDLLADAEGGKK